jgi:uncharacterized protein
LSGIFLLDVNILISSVWDRHSLHERVQEWFARNAAQGWATCPVTQTAFVRILSNPAFSPNALGIAEAITLLQKFLAHPAHRFWPDDIGIAQAVEKSSLRLKGHQQLTDAYLLGLAIHKKAKLATTDRGILELLPEDSPERERVALI